MSRCLGGLECTSLLFRYALVLLFFSNGGAGLAWTVVSALVGFGHGDILVMDGQCQDEFLHCTSPGLEHERINVTYRWIRQHTLFCPLLKAGMVCCLPSCAKGSSVQVTGNLGYSCFWAFLFPLCVLCMLEDLGLFFFFFFHPCCVQNLGLVGVPLLGLVPWGVAQLGHYLLDHWEESMAVHNTTFIIFWGGVYFRWFFFWLEAVYASLSWTAQSPWS